MSRRNGVNRARRPWFRKAWHAAAVVALTARAHRCLKAAERFCSGSRTGRLHVIRCQDLLLDGREGGRCQPGPRFRTEMSGATTVHPRHAQAAPRPSETDAARGVGDLAQLR